MKKLNFSGFLAFTSIVVAAPLLTNCGQNTQSSVSAIGYQQGALSSGCLAITGPIPFTASGVNYNPQESGEIRGGRLLYGQSYGTNAPSGTVNLGGGIVSGPLLGSGVMGTLAMDVTSVQQNPSYTGVYGNYYGTSPTLANATGTLTLSAQAQSQILAQTGVGTGGYGYQNQYPQQYPNQYPTQYPQQYPTQYPTQYPQQYPTQYPTQYPQQYPQQYGYNQPGMTSHICISNLAVNLVHRGNTLTGSVEITVNGSTQAQVIQF